MKKQNALLFSWILMASIFFCANFEIATAGENSVSQTGSLVEGSCVANLAPTSRELLEALKLTIESADAESRARMKARNRFERWLDSWFSMVPRAAKRALSRGNEENLKAIAAYLAARDALPKKIISSLELKPLTAGFNMNMYYYGPRTHPTLGNEPKVPFTLNMEYLFQSSPAGELTVTIAPVASFGARARSYSSVVRVNALEDALVLETDNQKIYHIDSNWFFNSSGAINAKHRIIIPFDSTEMTVQLLDGEAVIYSVNIPRPNVMNQLPVLAVSGALE